jgi:hypothetical protein
MQQASITHVRGFCGDSNQFSSLQGKPPDNTTLESHKDSTSSHSSRCGRDDLSPPDPSAHLPHDTSTGIRGWPMHYPYLHLLSMVG